LNERVAFTHFKIPYAIAEPKENKSLDLTHCFPLSILHCRQTETRRTNKEFKMEDLAQVLGLSATRVASAVISAAHNASAHRRNCERMVEQVRMIGNLLVTLESTEVARLPATKEPLDGLQEALRKALELVESCKDKSYLYMLAMGWSVVNQFRHVQTQIDRHLQLVPLISAVHDFRMQVLHWLTVFSIIISIFLDLL